VWTGWLRLGDPALSPSPFRLALGGELASICILSNKNPGIDFFQLKRSGASFRNINVGDRAGLMEVSQCCHGNRSEADHRQCFSLRPHQEWRTFW
jgi:hypothetical protein